MSATADTLPTLQHENPARGAVGSSSREHAFLLLFAGGHGYARAMFPPKLLVRRVGPIDVPIPAYQTAGSAGIDLAAAIAEPVVLAPRERRLVKTGIAIAIPEGYEGQVRPRSGLALRHGIGMVNTPGTIDSDYRGEVGVVLINLGAEPFTVEPLARIAQLVINPVARVEIEAVESLDDTARGAGGYGSTGV